MTIRIGGGQGFYGDSVTGAETLLEDGVDYLCLEALAELTLAILQKDRQKDPSLGYTRDLPLYLRAALPAVAQKKTKVITNAGGINPTGAARLVIDGARKFGVTGIKVATVTGDDILPALAELQQSGCDLANIETGRAFSELPAPPLFAAAYLGAKPIVEALRQGADIVITGRVADASLFLAPLIFEYGWSFDDWNKLASGILIGHLLECSGQSVGGNFSGSGWASKPSSWQLPYPIAEVEADGSAVITKPKGSSGAVTFDTLRHQLLYEVHDPRAYLSPDVVADFTTAKLEDLGHDRVQVSGVKGQPATATYKALLAHHFGWLGEARVAFAWPDAEAKARTIAAIFKKRVEQAGLKVDEWLFEFWGVDALGADTVPSTSQEAPEVVLRAAWRCGDRDLAKRVAREMVPLGLSAPAAGMTPQGRSLSDASELLALWPTLVAKASVDARVHVTVEET